MDTDMNLQFILQETWDGGEISCHYTPGITCIYSGTSPSSQCNYFYMKKKTHGIREKNEIQFVELLKTK